jgi:enoyl-CoA hydratase
MVMNCMKGGDFREGIRALLVDRDNSPKWSPPALEEVSAERVNAYFEPLGDHDLDVFAHNRDLDSRSAALGEK